MHVRRFRMAKPSQLTAAIMQQPRSARRDPTRAWGYPRDPLQADDSSRESASSVRHRRMSGSSGDGMNVLIYSGAGVSVESSRQTLEALRWHLSPNYAVGFINAQQVLNEPWAASTALLVFPGGADLPYVQALAGAGNRAIKKYVRNGGRYLGLCAGAYYGASAVTFEEGTPLEVSGPRELAFWDGTARGAVYKPFKYGSNDGAAAARIVQSDRTEFSAFSNGGCIFEEPTSSSGADEAEVLLRYADNVNLKHAPTQPPAVVFRRIGSGCAVLSGVHLEYSMETMVRDSMPTGVYDAIQHDSETRLAAMSKVLSKMGLRVVEHAGDAPGVPKLTPLLVTGLDEKLEPSVGEFMASISDILVEGRITDVNDTFEITDEASARAAAGKAPAAGSTTTNGVTTGANGSEFANGHSEARSAGNGTSTSQEVSASTSADPLVKKLVVCESWPDSRQTPYLNHHVYYEALRTAQSGLQVRPAGVGRLMFYGEIVTSTSTMIDKNPALLQRLPHGTVFVGTQQVQGRGRGTNVWVNPPGVMAVSGVLRVDAASLQHSPVFFQYLISLAVVEAFHSFGTEYRALDLRLKWPNDIYIARNGEYVKVGGVLTTMNLFDGEYVLTFGSGTNIDNRAPSTSINVAIDEYNERTGKNLAPITLEVMLARLLAKIDEFATLFMAQGFAPFEHRYYNAWLHQDKIVRLDAYNNARVRIRGITLDSGMLSVQEVDTHDRPTGAAYELQPDGNSFDMLKGLIRKKE